MARHTTNYGFNISEGTDLVNPLTDIFPNFEDIDTDLKGVSDSAVGTATELLTGTVHALVRSDSDRNVFTFTATSNFEAGETFTLDGVQVTALTPDGQTLSTGCYIIGSEVLVAVKGTLMTVYVNPSKALDSDKLDGHDSTYYATASDVSDLSGDVSAKVVGVGASINGNVTGTDSTTDVTKDLLKNVQEKVLHDYAFDLILNYSDTNKLIKNDDPQIGDIVLINDVLTFLDFKYFQALFSETGPVKFTNDQNKKNLEQEITKIKDAIPKGTAMPVLIKQQIEILKSTVNQAEPERKEMAKTIEIIRNTLPYDRVVLTTNMLVPLDNENFRDNPDIVAFKYGGNISIFGYVTNIFK